MNDDLMTGHKQMRHCMHVFIARRLSPTSKAESSIFVYIRRDCTRVYGTRRPSSKSNHKLGTCLSAEPENQTTLTLPRNPSYAAKMTRHLYDYSIT